MSDRRDQLLQTTGRELIIQLNGLGRGLSLYDPNNQAVVRLIDAITEGLVGFFTERPDEQRMTIQLLSEEFFVNHTLLKVDDWLYERASELAAFFARFDIGEIQIDREVSRETVVAYVEDLARVMRDGQASLKEGGYGAIRLGRSQGRSQSSMRLQEHMLAVSLYVSLQDVLERLYRRYKAGEYPSLLPLRRLLQLIIDAMKGNSGPYQMLAAVRDPEKPGTVVQQRSAVAIELLGLGLFLGLPKTDLMVLALAAVLGGMGLSDEPEEAIAFLYEFPGLGAFAHPLALTLYDARAARKGKKASLAGQMVATAEIYQQLTSPTRTRHGYVPQRAIGAMFAGKVPGASKQASQALAMYKGPYPLGWPVYLSGGILAVVVAHPGTEDGKRRPIVALVPEEGVLGTRIDLAERTDFEIEEAADPADAGLALLDLRREAEEEVPEEEAQRDVSESEVWSVFGSEVDIDDEDWEEEEEEDYDDVY